MRVNLRVNALLGGAKAAIARTLLPHGLRVSIHTHNDRFIASQTITDWEIITYLLERSF